jgi:hypothetical protein
VIVKGIKKNMNELDEGFRQLKRPIASELFVMGSCGMA